MSDKFVWILENFQIFDTAAWHEDTVWIYQTAKVGDTVIGPRHEKIGDRNNGKFTLDWEMELASVKPDTPVLLTYQFVNHGHDDAQKQLSDDITIAEKVSAAVGAVAGFVFPSSSAVAGTIVSALKDAGAALEWLFGEIDCDCMVLSDAITMKGSDLLSLTDGVTNTHIETRNYRGPETPHGCGADAEYAVTWSLKRFNSAGTLIDLNGRWAYGGIPGPIIATTSGALTVDMSTYHRPAAQGSVVDSSTITVSFPDAATETGKLQPPNIIRWSNGSVWTKVSTSPATLIDLNGRWAYGGIPGPIISPMSGALTVDMSTYHRPAAQGSVVDSSTITVSFPDAATETGKLQPPNIIRWSNGSVWTKV